jgi:hypothetical protein
VNVLKPHLQTTICTLLEARASQREIERVTGIDRKTIRAYQKRYAAAAAVAVAANSPGVATDSAEAATGAGCRDGLELRGASGLH